MTLNPVRIERALRKYLPSEGGVLNKAMRYSVFSGGKRIRPILTIESSIACGGSIKGAIPASCAIELVHTYSLIHDDLPAMDDDDYRRGKPTCHKAFGEANAILAGDALLTLAFNIIASSFKPVVGIKIIKELSDAIGAHGMVAGQALDLEFQDTVRGNALTKKIDLLKTAKLFSAATKIGALTAGGSTNEIKALEKFGLDFGLSFQIVDDYLDGRCSQRRKSITSLIEKAKSDLNIFGRNAENLRNMVECLSRRKK